MSSGPWYVSDTHFGHDNIIKFTCHDNPARPIRPGYVDPKGDLVRFLDIQHHDELYIARHNARVGQYDKVYFLGDFGRKIDMLDRLNGKWNFIVGNHDDQIDSLKLAKHPKINWVRCARDLGETEGFPMPIRLIHYPTHPTVDWPSSRRICVHGHIHEKTVKRMRRGDLRWQEDDPWYVNICVEHTNHAPLHHDELVDIIKARHTTLKAMGEIK